MLPIGSKLVLVIRLACLSSKQNLKLQNLQNIDILPSKNQTPCIRTINSYKGHHKSYRTECIGELTKYPSVVFTDKWKCKG